MASHARKTASKCRQRPKPRRILLPPQKAGIRCAGDGRFAMTLTDLIDDMLAAADAGDLERYRPLAVAIRKHTALWASCWDGDDVQRVKANLVEVVRVAGAIEASELTDSAAALRKAVRVAAISGSVMIFCPSPCTAHQQIKVVRWLVGF